MKGLIQLLLLVTLAASFSYAQIPRIINYQGILLGANEQPVPEGEYDLTFTIYDEPGNVLWTETHNQVYIAVGLFHVHLGGIVPLELPFNQAYFLGIKVGDDPELSPRLLFTSAAYAINSENAEALQGFRLSEIPMPNVIIPLDSAGMFPSSVIPGGGTGGIGGGGITNYLPRFTSGTSIGNSIIFQHNGNLGIGTETPSVKFELAGSDAKIYGLTVGRGAGSLGSNVAFGIEALHSNQDGDNNCAIGLQALYNNGSGTSNIAIGTGALYHNTGGAANTAVGHNAMYHNKWQNSNTAIGYGSMFFANNATSGNITRNTAVGAASLSGSDIPANNTGTDNTAIGYFAINAITSGSNNSALGSRSLESNTTGIGNTALGFWSLLENTTGGGNTGVGTLSLRNNTGNFNTACGATSLFSNLNGDHNTALGNQTLTDNTTGEYNTGIGDQSLFKNTTGNYNTAIGASAGSNGLNVNSGTFLGTSCWANSDNLSNITGIGYQSRPTASNQIRFGNTSVTSIGGYANWTNFSDGRYKESIAENVKGISFIMKLRPVTFRLNIEKLSSDLDEDIKYDENGNIITELNNADQKARVDKSKIQYTGFIAQEVESAAREVGFEFSGVDRPDNPEDFYGLRYADFVVPLVKAVQEQQKLIEELTARIEELEGK
jgi:hypothetical protein